MCALAEETRPNNATQAHQHQSAFIARHGNGHAEFCGASKPMPTAPALHGGLCRLSACLPTAAAALILNGDFGTSPFYWQPSAGNGPICL
jgi:hypothetical protein